MNAILLAAGFGTRLRPLTEKIPKCLVPIGNKPLLEIWLERLSQSQIRKFLINTHYMHEQVVKFVTESQYAQNCTLVYEPDLLGTAGTVSNSIDFTEGNDCMLIHADNYCLADFSKFIKAHQERPADCLVTMMIFETATPESCGIVKLDAVGKVIEFHEKVSNPPSNLANGAVYILSHELISLFGTVFKGMTDFSTEIIPRLMGKIYTYKTNDVFMDIGTPQSYEMANRISAPGYNL